LLKFAPIALGNFAQTEFSKQLVHGNEWSPNEWWLLPNNPAAMRLGYPEGPLTLRVFGCERLQRFSCLVEFVGPLDRNR
jgi:hypothetical protein